MAFHRTQLFVRSALHDSPALQDDDLVAISNGAESMGNDQASASAAAKVVVDQLLRLRIESAGGFIEDQNAWSAR